MADPSARPRLHRSVFAKLVAIMVIMALSLVMLVSIFFWIVVTRNIHSMINRSTAHVGLLILLLVVIVAIVLVAHAFLRHQLRPLRMLSDGVTRLGEGELDIQLPRTTQDEFATLTDGFNRMVGRVREMIGARDQLLVDVSHELRSPLTRMKVALELLRDDPQRARLAADIAEMERLVSGLLEMERLRTRRGLRTAAEDLAAILRATAERFQDTPPGVRVTAPPEIWLEIDGEKVCTVLQNLLENAIKYSLPDSRPIEIAAVEHADRVVVRVTDDGVGVPDSEADRIFEPFYRVDRSRSKRTGGYGLGLGICKRVMEAHGGSIAVERSAERGASFVLTFQKQAPSR